MLVNSSPAFSLEKLSLLLKFNILKRFSHCSDNFLPAWSEDDLPAPAEVADKTFWNVSLPYIERRFTSQMSNAWKIPPLFCDSFCNIFPYRMVFIDAFKDWTISFALGQAVSRLHWSKSAFKLTNCRNCKEFRHIVEIDYAKGPKATPILWRCMLDEWHQLPHSCFSSL